MSEANSTPRITAQLLDNYVGQNVMIVGTIVQLRSDTAIMDSAGNINLALNREAHLVNGNSAQVIGKVNPDHSVKVLTSKDVGPNVDFQLYQSVVDTTHQYKNLFDPRRAAVVWPGEGEGVTWVGENLAREGLSDVSSETDDWSDLVWSGSEDGVSVKEEVKAKKEVEDDVYTQTERLFAETSREAGESEITEVKNEMGKDLGVGRIQESNKEMGKAPETLSFTSAPPTGPSRRQMPWGQKPVPKGGYKLNVAPSRPTPKGSSASPSPSTPRRTGQKLVDNSEIMQHLVGGMANLAIPMSQDNGGRWRIHKRQ